MFVGLQSHKEKRDHLRITNKPDEKIRFSFHFYTVSLLYEANIIAVNEIKCEDEERGNNHTVRVVARETPPAWRARCSPKERQPDPRSCRKQCSDDAVADICEKTSTEASLHI